MEKQFVVPGYGPVPVGQDLIINCPTVLAYLTGIMAVRIGADRRTTVVREDGARTADIDLSKHDVSTNEGIVKLAQAVENAQ